MIKAEKIWIDGKLVPFEDSKVHVLTHALHYGIGVFEGIRAYKGADGRSAIFRLREHVQRLYDSAHIVLMQIPFSPDQLEKACVEVLKANKLDAGYLRPLAFFGAGAMGVGATNPVQVIVAAWPWGAYLSEEGLKRGIRAKVSSFNRMHVNVQMVRAKISGQYVNSFLANREPAMAGSLIDAVSRLARTPDSSHRRPQDDARSRMNSDTLPVSGPDAAVSGAATSDTRFSTICWSTATSRWRSPITRPIRPKSSAVTRRTTWR